MSTCATGTSLSGIDVLVPVLVAVDLAAHRGEEHFLDLAGDGSWVTDLAIVDGPDGHDLGGGAREEGFVGRVEVGAEDVAGRALDPEVAGDRHHRVLGDALEGARRRGRRDDPAVLDDEDVLTRALADV